MSTCKICDIHLSKVGRKYWLEYYELNEDETSSKYVCIKMVKLSTLQEKMEELLKKNEIV